MNTTYESPEDKLRAAFNKPDLFTLQCGDKDGPSVTVTRTQNGYDISAVAEIDEFQDLTDTAIWEAVGGNATCTSGCDWIAQAHQLDPDKDAGRIDEILDEMSYWIEEVYAEYHIAESTAPLTTTFEELLHAVYTTADEAEKLAEACYKTCVEYMREGIDAGTDDPYENGWVGRDGRP